MHHPFMVEEEELKEDDRTSNSKKSKKSKKKKSKRDKSKSPDLFGYNKAENSLVWA